MSSPERLPQEALVSLSTLGLFFIALGAFSKKSKYEIHKRDNWICVGCGAVHPLEASHKNHDRNNPSYDHPDNGDTRCPGCHLEQHIENAGHNGLSDENNDRAIKSLEKRS